MSDLLPTVEQIGVEKLAEWSAEDTWRLFIVCHFQREGQSEWMATLEHTHYTPGTPRNGLFELMLTHWEGMPWWIVAVPLQERHHVMDVNAKLKWRLANGVPCILSPRNPKRSTLPVRFVGSVRPQQFGPTSPVVIKNIFPLRSQRTFTLEQDRQVRHGTPPGEPVPSSIVFPGDGDEERIGRVIAEVNRARHYERN